MPHTNTQLSVFAQDVLQGLSGNPKTLSSKYFYDTKGDELFKQIMAMPEYYLTNSEQEIFDLSKSKIAEALGDRPLDIIELGAGDGTKTSTLLTELVGQNKDARYIPSDISPNILSELQQRLNTELPALQVFPLAGDYFHSLANLPDRSDRKRVFFYLGSNIGNLEKNGAVLFLKFLHQYLKTGDQILIGIDLKKDPSIILNAYDDPHGHTANFNLNLLARINRELGANFDLNHFRHWESYDPLTGSARSYLVSKREQQVTIESLQRSFHFDAWESIGVELSQKYNPLEIDELAKAAGYRREIHFFDSRARFVDSLWNY